MQTIVVAEVPPHLSQLVHHLEVVCVEHLRPAHGDGADGPMLLVKKRLQLHIPSPRPDAMKVQRGRLVLGLYTTISYWATRRAAPANLAASG